MCGIVFAGGSLSSGDLEIFNQLLYCDVFRGSHATGIFAKRQNEGVSYIKSATEPYPFMHSPEYIDVTQGKTKYVVPPVFVVGHNRHATRGNAGDSKNAHPFQHGNITLVHNGTLTDQSLLPDHLKFVVDSENICYSIDKIGAAETIQKLDGAFTLIWHDASDDTVHIIRNEERPFHLAKVGGLDWFGASEEDMLMWILKRNKSYKSRITEHFECEVGVEYVFDVSGTTKRCFLKDRIKHDLPTFTVASRYGYNYSRSGWSNDYGVGRSAANPGVLGAESGKQGRETARASEREKQNAIAIANNIDARIDGRITMCPHSWFPYTTGITDKRGRITGWVYLENGEYYEVDLHSAQEGMWEDCCDDPNLKIIGTVVSIQKVNGTVRVIMTGPSIVRDGQTVAGEVKTPAVAALPAPRKEPALPDDDSVPFETDLPASFTMENGVVMTRAQWAKHDHSKCGGCDQTIPWKDAVKGKAIMAYNCFWHEKCLAEVLDNNAGNKPDTFKCHNCGVERSMDLLHSFESSYCGEDTCDHCANQMKLKRKAANEAAQAGVASSGNKQVNKPFTTVPPDDAQVTGVSASFVDKTAKAISEGNDSVTQQVFSRDEFRFFIKMRESDLAKFENLGQCYIEKRSANLYAYKYKRGTDLSINATKEEPITSNVASFSAGVRAAQSESNLSKTLTSGSKTLHINKALWNQIGQCHNCFTQIPWRDAEKCALAVNNRIICPDCRGK